MTEVKKDQDREAMSEDKERIARYRKAMSEAIDHIDAGRTVEASLLLSDNLSD